MKRLSAFLGSALLALTLAAPVFAQDQAPPAQTPLPPSVAGAPAGERMAASPEMIAARRAMRSACATDVATLCGDAQAAPGASTGDAAAPGAGRGGARMQCLRGHVAQVSPPCRQALAAMRDARKAAKS